MQIYIRNIKKPQGTSIVTLKNYEITCPLRHIIKLHPRSLLNVSVLCFKTLQNVLFITWEVLLLSTGIPELAEQLLANPKTNSRQKQQWTVKLSRRGKIKASV